MFGAAKIYNTGHLKNTYHIFHDLEFEKKELLIVLIDDSKKDISLLEEMLLFVNDFKIKTIAYNSPIEALHAIERNEVMPDLIIMDLVMPGIDGKIALSRLKSCVHSDHIPVVIYSSMNNYQQVSQINALDAHAFFAKPIDINSFSKFLHNVIA